MNSLKFDETLWKNSKDFSQQNFEFIDEKLIYCHITTKIVFSHGLCKRIFHKDSNNGRRILQYYSNSVSVDGGNLCRLANWIYCLTLSVFLKLSGKDTDGDKFSRHKM